MISEAAFPFFARRKKPQVPKVKGPTTFQRCLAVHMIMNQQMIEGTRPAKRSRAGIWMAFAVLAALVIVALFVGRS